MPSLGLIAGWVKCEGVGFVMRTGVEVVLLGRWVGLATTHAVYLYQHGCFRTRCRLPSLRSIPLWFFASVRADFRAAPVTLRSEVHRRVQLGVGGCFDDLQGSGKGTVPTVSVGGWGAVLLAAHTADAPCGPVVMSVRAGPGPLGLTAALHGLELGEGHNIGPLGSVPDCAAPGGVVVVEAAALGVKQLPPLVAVRLAHRNIRRGIPAALARGQVHIHSFT